MTTWLRGARCTDPEAMPENGSAAPGRKPPRWSAERRASRAHGTRRASPARKSRLANATTEQVRLPALRPPLQEDGRDHKGTTRAQKRASGTRTVVLFGIVNSRCAPLRGSRHNVSNRRRLPAAVWPRACRMPCRATRIVGAGGYPSTPAHCIFPVVYNAARWTAPFACCCKAYGASHSLRLVPDLVEFTLGPRECVPAPSLSLQPKSDVSDFGDQCVADLG